MIFVGIGQIFAGTLLIIAGWYLLVPTTTPTHSIIGAIAILYGAWVLFKSVDRVDPPGV